MPNYEQSIDSTPSTTAAFLPAVAPRHKESTPDHISENPHPPRVEHLSNGELVNATGNKVITPDPEIMAQIERETNGKVRYFPIKDIDGFRETSGYVTEPIFFNYVMSPLTQEIVSRFPGKTLALRGVATSINGHIRNYSEYDLWDITETIGNGNEKADASFNVAVLDPEEPLSIDRVNQYASYVGSKRTFDATSSDDADATFPAILVFDATMLRRTGGHYGATFKENVDPQDALLAVYIVDCPEL